MSNKQVVVEFHAKGEVKVLEKRTWTMAEAIVWARNYMQEFLNEELEPEEEEDEFEVGAKEQHDGSVRVGPVDDQEQVDTLYFLEIREVAIQ